MELLIAGLTLFISGHSIRLIAPQWRLQQIHKLGDKRWKLLFSMIAATALALMIIGYNSARQHPHWLWLPPLWTRHLAALLTLPATLLIIASQVPGNRLQSTLRHPMYAGLALWATAHLLANGGVHDLIFFGALLLWSVSGLWISVQRDRRLNNPAPAYLGLKRDLLTLGAGLAGWVALALWLHALLIGVAPLA